MTMVEAVVQRLMLSVTAATVGTHRHRIPLGLVLLNQGLLTQSQLRLALDAQKSAGYGRIGYWLISTCGVTPAKITRALAAQWNRPVLSSIGFVAERMALVMPESLRVMLRVLPTRVAAGKILYAAFEDEVDASAVAALERMSGLAVESGLLAQDEFAMAESRLQIAPAVASREEQILDAKELCTGVVEMLWDMQPVASRLTYIRGVWWLRMWLERGACSRQGILPATGEDVVDVLYRIAT